MNEIEVFLAHLRDSSIPFNFKIADTVIYRQGRPHAWFFSSKDGKVKKKKKSNLSNDSIITAFSKQKQTDAPIAYVYSYGDRGIEKELLTNAKFSKDALA